jgi:Lrp/AsnC family transcriptional regulator, leucine-responsive regulatory protein
MDTIDERILFELDKNSRIPEVRLAKLIKKSKESVRYRIKKLLDQKIITGFSVWLDIPKLGYDTAKFYFNLANIPSKKKEFLDYLKKDKRTFWVGVAEGAWNVGATFFVKDNKEFFDLKAELFGKFKGLILECKTASLVEIYQKPKTFLHPSNEKFSLMLNKREDLKLDEIEVYILRELFKNSRVNIAEISGKYDVSVDKIKYRIKRLEKEKIISRYNANIDFSKLGYDLYKTFIYTKNLDKESLDALISYCEKNKNIAHVVKQISEWDLELEILCKNYHEYNEIISNLTEKFSKVIQKVETAIMGEDYVFPARNFVFE